MFPPCPWSHNHDDDAPDSPVAASSSTSSSAAHQSLTGLQRHAVPPSLSSLVEADALRLILAFELSELPGAVGRPSLPDAAIGIVHEYATDLSFVIELDGPAAGPTAAMTNRIVCDSTADFMRWLGAYLPPGFLPSPYAFDDYGERSWLYDDDPTACAFDNSCAMGEQLTVKYGADVSRLLRAQLRANEYLACYLDIPTPTMPADRTFDPADYVDPAVALSEHRRFCGNELSARKAKIVASGRVPVPVIMSDLLERLRLQLKAGGLPRGMSPHPCDWAPLFRWSRAWALDWNKDRRDLWKGSWRDGIFGHEPEECPFVPAISAVWLQSTIEGVRINTQSQACVWSHQAKQRLMQLPGALFSAEEADSDDQLTGARPVVSILSADPIAMSADEEAATRGAPRQKRR